MRIVALLRVKNEARWIEKVLGSIRPLCDPIIVLDDHSDDGTPALCEAVGATVLHSKFSGIDESRDKTFLLEAAAAFKPDWCYMIDGDEFLEPNGPDLIRASISGGQSDSYMFPLLYLWDRLDQIRVDRVYSRMRRHSLWKFVPGDRFRTTHFGGNFHCGSVPERVVPLPKGLCAARILHLGYLHREDRIRKYEWYNRIDPGNELEDCYRHMVIGDIFPATSAFKHAGPLQLAPLV